MMLHRGLLFWGLALITAGAVALAAQQNVLDRNALAGAWRLWPLILIAIGLSIVLSRTPFAVVGTIVGALVVGIAGGAAIAVGPGFASCGGAEPSTPLAARGQFTGVAQVTLDFNCGSLDVATTDDEEWMVRTGRESGDPARVTADGDSLRVESGQNDRWWDGGRQLWIVSLPKAITYELYISPNAADTAIDLAGGHFTVVSLHPNAGAVTLDLTAAQVDTLDLSLNAGSASITVGEAADVSGAISVNAGSIELCTHGEVAFRLTVEDNITFSHNLEESGLGQDGDIWSYSPPVPPGAALSFVELRIEGNAASFTLNPEGGCE